MGVGRTQNTPLDGKSGRKKTAIAPLWPALVHASDVLILQEKNIAACNSFYCMLITKAASTIMVQKWHL
jgi:hypothetical protein